MLLIERPWRVALRAPAAHVVDLEHAGGRPDGEQRPVARHRGAARELGGRPRAGARARDRVVASDSRASPSPVTVSSAAAVGGERRALRRGARAARHASTGGVRPERSTTSAGAVVAHDRDAPPVGAERGAARVAHARARGPAVARRQTVATPLALAPATRSLSALHGAQPVKRSHGGRPSSLEAIARSIRVPRRRSQIAARPRTSTASSRRESGLNATSAAGSGRPGSVRTSARAAHTRAVPSSEPVSTRSPAPSKRATETRRCGRRARAPSARAPTRSARAGRRRR